MGRLIRNVLRLTFLLALVGAGGLAWTYYRSDELLRTEVLRQLAQALPEATISLERANFDLRGRVRLFDLVVRLPGDERPVLSIAETIVAIDQRQFAEHQRLVINHVRISQPRVRMVRAPDGRWNWQGVTFVRPPENLSVPEIAVLHGQVEVVLPDHATRTMISIPISEVMLSGQPSSRKSFDVKLSLRTEFTETLHAEGDLPLEPAPWSLQLHAARCQLSPATTRLVLIAIPELQAPFARLQQQLAQHVPSASPPTARSAQGTSGVTATVGGAGPYDLGVTLVGAVRVKAAQSNWESPVDWAARLEIAEGQLTHAALPNPLFDLQGEVELHPGELLIRKLAARNGLSQLQLQAAANREGGLNALVNVTALPIEEPLIARLPDALQKHVRAMELTGLVTGQIQLQRGVDGRHQIDAEATLEKGSLRHERFPYRVRDIQGSASWHHDTVQIQAQGMGGITPVRVTGTIHHPGPTGDAAFEVRADGFAMDDPLLQALPPQVARVVDELRFQGRGDAWVRLLRPAGLDQKYQVSLLANIRDASVSYVGFPYPISQISGRLAWSGDVVSFDDVRGQHDGAVITGSGKFFMHPDPGHLTMTVNSTNTAFDRALYAALPEHLQEVWRAFSPQGQFDTTARVDWIVGQPVQVDVPRLQILDADIQLRELPYPFRQLKGLFAYRAREQRVEIQEFSTRHDDTRVRGAGHAQIHDNGTVTLELAKFHVDDLTPTPAFRRALPIALRDVVEALNPTGSYSFHGPVKFYGDQSRGGIIGAEWDLQLLLAGCAMNAGLRIGNIHGRVHLGGRWTPQKTDLNGELDLDAIDVLVNHQLTKVRGPFRLRDGVLTFGSAAMANATRGEEVARVMSAERITAEAFDGRATLDAQVDLNSEPKYVASMELNGASLEKYAMRHLRGYSNVRGLMNGWMDIRGAGVAARGLSGEGQLQISPAALYELPVFLQIFQLPQFAPINRTAFDYANFFFRIDNERFNFQTIDLVGNTISLRGRGVVRFDGGVMLDFYSMQPRNQVRLPGLRELVGVVNMVSQGWMAVEVRGPIGAPVARVVPLPAVDNALQQFLGAFNPRAVAPPPVIYRGPPQTTATPEFPRQ